jgi:hypothetical protein
MNSGLKFNHAARGSLAAAVCCAASSRVRELIFVSQLALA